MVTSSAVVGSSAIRSEGLHDSAIAIIARWRMPPENWCGYSWTRCFRVGDADRFDHFDGALFGFRLTHILVKLDRFRDLAAHRMHGESDVIGS